MEFDWTMDIYVNNYIQLRKDSLSPPLSLSLHATRRSSSRSASSLFVSKLPQKEQSEKRLKLFQIKMPGKDPVASSCSSSSPPGFLHYRRSGSIHDCFSFIIRRRRRSGFYGDDGRGPQEHGSWHGLQRLCTSLSLSLSLS